MPTNVDLEATLLGPIVAGRDCAGCGACCDVLKVDTTELQKPADTACAHRSSQGCAIHAVRPPICRTWFCGWRRIAAMPDAARPDLCGLMVSLDFVQEPRNCFEGVSILVRSFAGKAAFDSAMAERIIDLLCDQLVPVWLSDGSKKMLIHPESDVAALVISGEAAPEELRDEVAAWRARFGMFGADGG